MLAALLFASAGCSLPVPAHGELGPRPRRPRTSFVVIGDTQRSLWAEEHLLGREQNELDRPRLIDQLAREENPAFVVHLGDLVAAASPPHWRYFDELMKPLADAKIRVLPVLGNHEYFGEGRDPSRSARRRHPELARGGYYAKRWGRLGLVWLDSNLTGRRAARQVDWLSRTLARFDDAPDTTGTLVFTHHPPVTNGVAREGQGGVRDELLPVIRRSKKVVALLCAHVHGYERFDLDGLPLVVSGGGGGPRVEYRIGGARSLAPAVLDDPLPRPLHYLVVRDTGRSLDITARCLAGSPGCPENGSLDRVNLALPRAPGRDLR